MKFSTEAISKMVEILVSEMKQIGLEEAGGIRDVEIGMREVGVQALGSYWEQKDEEIQETEKICACGKRMNYLFKREGRS